MTEQEIAGLGPAFAAYLGRYRDCFLQKRTAAHFDTYCRGLLSDLPRKSVEPIALEAGTAVRTLQEFLVTARWDHQRAPALLPPPLAQTVAAARPPQAARGRNGRGGSRRPAGHGRRHRRDELLQVGRSDARSAAAIPGLPGQDRQRHRHGPCGHGPGSLPGAFGCRSVLAPVVG